MCYDKALDINPKYTNAWYNKGLVLDYLRKYEEAIKCYDKALELNPNDTKAKTAKEEDIKALSKTYWTLFLQFLQGFSQISSK